MDTTDHLAVIDWRRFAPSIYYDNLIGQVKYLASIEIISEFFSIKRQIIAENQILKEI